MLETWVDLVEDTIFVSDILCTVHKLCSIMMNPVYADRITRIAFADELVDPPAAVLRKMQGLTHLSLVMGEYGHEYGFDHEDSDDGLAEDEEEAEEKGGPHPYNNTDCTQEEESESVPSANAGDTPAEGEEGDQAEQERGLSLQEADIMERISAGCFRHVGNIHFESVTHTQIETDFEEQHVGGEAWSRPLIAIVETTCGLKYIGRASAIDWKTTVDRRDPATAASDATEDEKEQSATED
ncbi:unnamed protein product [Diplocarpon coronariae]